jgi:DNA-directed RNA polymerase subunit beta'
MLRWVKVEEVGDTEFLVDEQVDKFVFQTENRKIIEKGKKPAMARPLLLGITKSALSTDSFISAASFQETTRVLTEASLYGKVDHLRRLKENIIMGRLIPAGTGYKFYRNVELKGEKEEEERREIDITLPS